MVKKYVIKKYDGDDMYSWAVFYAKDVKGLRSPIFWGEAEPIICGLSRISAQHERNHLENKN